MDFRSFCSRLIVAGLALMTLVSCNRDGLSLEERLQAGLDKRLRQCGAKGASVAVIFPDESLWLGTSGISHETVKMEPDMSFAVGSITKNMVAVLVLELAEEGKLSLEDPIGRWLPSYTHVDNSITIRQLLNHTSGLYMFWENQKIWDDLIRFRSKKFSPDEVLGYLKEPYFPPGKGSRYSNTNYLLAAVIVTRATGSSLAVELRERFWEPLGLRSARLAIEEPYPEKLAHVWGNNFEKDGAYRDITALPRASHDSITYGSAGVFMTAEDLARWTHALFHGRVIRKASLEEMLDLTEGGSYGLGIERLGWRIVGRLAAFGHGGGNIGTSGYMVHLPDHDISIAVMINQFGGRCASRILREVGKIAADSVKPEPIIALLWSFEGLLGGFWLLAGLGVVIFAIRTKRPVALILSGSLLILAGWVSTRTVISLDYLLWPEGAVLLTLGFVQFILLRALHRRI